MKENKFMQKIKIITNVQIFLFFLLLLCFFNIIILVNYDGTLKQVLINSTLIIFLILFIIYLSLDIIKLQLGKIRRKK